MNQKPIKSIEQIFQEDSRYPVDAVEFIREGLSFTIEWLRGRKGSGDHFDDEIAESNDGLESPPMQHVSGQQLCEGLRVLAQKKWGFLARQVLRRWNINDTRDFGEIVFLLVDNGWMQKQPHDCIEDFDQVYDFEEVFEKRYDFAD